MTTPGALTILVAEDDELDVHLLQRAFQQAEVSNPLQVVRDGLEAVEFLNRMRSHTTERLPALVILDLKMPRKGGMQVLQWMREQPIIRSVPVIIFSSSANRNDVETAYESGANAYLIKPPSTAERVDTARFIKNWLRLSQAPVAASESFQAAQGMRLPAP